MERSSSLGFKLAVVTKYSTILSIVILGPIWLLGYLADAQIFEGWSILLYIAETFGVVGGMLFTFSWIMRTWGWLFHSNDPEYQEFLAQGRDPYFYRFERYDHDTPQAPDLSGWDQLLNMPRTQPGRVVNCWNCHKDVQEVHLGDLENGGIVCPYCGKTMLPL